MPSERKRDLSRSARSFSLCREGDASEAKVEREFLARVKRTEIYIVRTRACDNEGTAARVQGKSFTREHVYQVDIVTKCGATTTTVQRRARPKYGQRL